MAQEIKVPRHVQMSDNIEFVGFCDVSLIPASHNPPNSISSELLELKY